ncbi:oxygen-binding di-iron domain-containing protein [Marinobacter subterrani]|uniref:Metallo-beta-lactamase superfamily n=1 Tax=Marinobacter subterrani TaxID=1658765 RepID=A0A0J7M210_9GAMM|nr:MBL fold metallo-hydrolase [Marinobacter subterrani]KMQ75070.1 Metallo-beta-lactamase superfamily [Marinobacter subterrani]
MAAEPIVLFDSLVTGEGVQSNQFLIVDGKHEALIDPGGDLTYTPLSVAASRYMNIRELDYVFASHQDPDIIGAIDRWIVHTRARIVTSKLWARFLPHLVSSYVTSQLSGSVYDRIVSVPDAGANVRFGDSFLQCLPAHFMHSVGNLQFYDPVSKILFSGDLGASLGGEDDHLPVKDFDKHIPNMVGFHRRYIASRKVCQLWASMIRDMDVAMIVPQHGKRFEGPVMVERFLDWVSNMECGIDLMTQDNYRRPVDYV